MKNHAVVWLYVWWTCVVAMGIFTGGFLVGRGVGQADVRPTDVARLPEVHVDSTPAVEHQLEQCRAFTKMQAEILDDDRKLEEDACSRRIEALVRETYPKGSRLIIRSGTGPHDVGWFLGNGAPKTTCNSGSIYSRIDGPPSFYACEAGAWRPK
jgi:hypothetical protein